MVQCSKDSSSCRARAKDLVPAARFFPLENVRRRGDRERSCGSDFRVELRGRQTWLRHRQGTESDGPRASSGSRPIEPSQRSASRHPHERPSCRSLPWRSSWRPCTRTGSAPIDRARPAESSLKSSPSWGVVLGKRRRGRRALAKSAFEICRNPKSFPVAKDLGDAKFLCPSEKRKLHDANDPVRVSKTQRPRAMADRPDARRRIPVCGRHQNQRVRSAFLSIRSAGVVSVDSSRSERC